MSKGLKQEAQLLGLKPKTVYQNTMEEQIKEFEKLFCYKVGTFMVLNADIEISVVTEWIKNNFVARQANPMDN